MSEDTELGKDAMIKKSLVCPHCVIGEGAKIVNSIVHKRAVIGKGYEMACVKTIDVR